MADYPIRTTDEHGNLVPQRDEYGEPTPYSGATGGYGPGTGTGYEGEHQKKNQVGVTGMLHRSGSSSSSSSEDDGMGGRRKKKGVKEKIKDMLPGGRKDQPVHGTTTTTAAGTTGTGYETGHGTTTTTSAGEKKGMMEKIREKLPGGGHHHN